MKILEYKALKAGTRIITVDRDYPLSQLCSECGYKNPAIKDLKIREWECLNCHMKHDRDKNAEKTF